VRNESFEIRNRAEFDEFWVSGIELGQMRSLAVFDVPPTSPNVPAGKTPAPPPAPAHPLDDPPVTAQVWWTYAAGSLADKGVDLLIDPTPAPGVRRSGAVSSQTENVRSAMEAIQQRVIDGKVTLETTRLTLSFGYIAMDLDFEEMVTRLLPLTTWRPFLEDALALTQKARVDTMKAYRSREAAATERAGVGWFLHLLAICANRDASGPKPITYTQRSAAIVAVNKLLARVRLGTPLVKPIGRVTVNREVKASVNRSAHTVKVDATRGLFGVRCDNIRWAVVDTGVDARHIWFRHLDPQGVPFADAFENNEVIGNYTRISRAYDFAKQREGTLSRRNARGERNVEVPGDVPLALANGEQFYDPPENGHGTHVAGIIGGSGGLCPDIELHDYRVLGADGKGNEFSVVAALRHILDLTQMATRADPAGRSRDLPIHGVNLSLALDADVSSDACGWSLVCRVCDELVRAGVVVVVSAGNTGFEDRTGSLLSTGQNYRTVSITDPGNTERVVTVGSTDPDRPREYGVSYFSARGPTADGRAKPDLVAPGSLITSSYGYRRGEDDRRDGAATLNGTSMAAAHVSACAALLMARHRELIGKPDEVKRILMASATDLQRDRNFQGAGLVDALRAVQFV
jgi:Subtilase family